MALALKLVLRKLAVRFMDFKQQVSGMTENELISIYTDMEPVRLQHKIDTDLSRPVMDRIVDQVTGPKILDVGCGQGFLAGRLSLIGRVTACDIVIYEDAPMRNPEVDFQSANVTDLPFDDDAFDTVTCTHTLEHILNLNKALRELRRVAAKRLIIVLPKERPYLYTFNLHVHFFPYRHSVEIQLAQSRSNSKIQIDEIDGSWLFQEDLRS